MESSNNVIGNKSLFYKMALKPNSTWEGDDIAITVYKY